MKPHAVFFDLDSTLSKIEGLDWIAEKKGVGERMKEITRKAMNGEMDIPSALKEKMNTIAPSKEEFIELGKTYINSLVQNAKELVAALHKKNYTVGIVTGSFFLPASIVGKELGIPEECIFANTIYFDERGCYTGYDPTNPLATNTGKAEVIKKIKDNFESITFVGDGVTDLATLPFVTTFIGFGGIEERQSVKEKAKHYITSPDLLQVLSFIP